MSSADPLTVGEPDSGVITEVLSRIRLDEPEAWSALLRLVTDDLHRLGVCRDEIGFFGGTQATGKAERECFMTQSTHRW